MALSYFFSLDVELDFVFSEVEVTLDVISDDELVRVVTHLILEHF